MRWSVVAPSPSRAFRVRRVVPLLLLLLLLVAWLPLLFWSAGTSIHCKIDGSPSGFFTSGDCLSPSSCSGVYLMLAAGVCGWAAERGGAGGRLQGQFRLECSGCGCGCGCVCSVAVMQRQLSSSRA